MRPKINCGNVGTSPVGRIINDCNGKHTSHENEEDTMKFLISSWLVYWCASHTCGVSPKWEEIYALGVKTHLVYYTIVNV